MGITNVRYDRLVNLRQPSSTLEADLNFVFFDKTHGGKNTDFTLSKCELLGMRLTSVETTMCEDSRAVKQNKKSEICAGFDVGLVPQQS